MRETKRREDGWEMKGRLRLRSIRERRGWMGDEVIEGACEGTAISGREMKGMKGRVRLRLIRGRRGWMGDEGDEGACEVEIE
ncbi:hypothetical protein SO802_020428 [Lithocarpus litseifolius]|uniref:Uncharacterized protein n=1 Tax=Lithocarpus litseifolius TaxID=425828 RepID=A0AAW2CCC9_9ROSI